MHSIAIILSSLVFYHLRILIYSKIHSISSSTEGHYQLLIVLLQTTKDDFGVSWKTQNDESASCGAVRVPIVIKSNEIFYSKRGTDFINVFKKELEDLSHKV